MSDRPVVTTEFTQNISSRLVWWVQSSYLGRDIGYNAVFRGRPLSFQTYVGILYNFGDDRFLPNPLLFISHYHRIIQRCRPTHLSCRQQRKIIYYILMDIVACRVVARQQPRNKQAYNSRC
jgi:hypothetical protein